MGDLAAGIDDDLAGPLAALGIDDVVDGELAFDLDDIPTALGLHLLGLVEQFEDLGVGRVLGIHRPQQRERRKLAALVDPHLERVLLRHVELDPAATLRDDPAVVGLAIARLRVGHEVDARRPVQLAHHHPLGTVDDELAAPEHDGDIAEIDLFLDRLLAGEPQPDPQRPAIGEPQLSALVGAVPRLPEFVPQILDLDGPVVALDREDLPQHALDALVLPLGGRHVVLQELVVEPGLDLGQIGDEMANATAAEVANFTGLETADGASCH